MTIPTSIQIPLNQNVVSDDLTTLQTQIRVLTTVLEDMYSEVAYGVNGEIRADSFVQRSQWLPTLYGTTTAGSFTYTNQTGWSYRQGLFVDAWFDVSWTATGGAAGNLYLELPYQVAVTSNMPFVGVCQPSAFAFTGGTGIVINGISDTYRGEFWNVGNGFTTARQAVVGSGRIIGHIRYMGQANEE